jgi:hypothetical protein
MDERTAQTPVSRRELLKALAASGIALTAVASLPARWVKPFVEAGLLPAHAQGSICAKLFANNYPPNCFTPGSCQGFDSGWLMSYLPQDLKIIDVEFTAGGLGCADPIRYGWGPDRPGYFWLYFNQADFQFCTEYRATMIVTFEGGCIGVFDTHSSITK